MGEKGHAFTLHLAYAAEFAQVKSEAVTLLMRRALDTSRCCRRRGPAWVRFYFVEE